MMSGINENTGKKDKNKENKNRNTGIVGVAIFWDPLQMN